MTLRWLHVSGSCVCRELRMYRHRQTEIGNSDDRDVTDGNRVGTRADPEPQPDEPDGPRPAN